MTKIVCRTVAEDYDGDRLDSYLGVQEVYASRSAAAKAVEAGLVKVNGEVQSSKKHLVRAEDSIEAEVPDEVTAPIHLEPQKIPLDIRFEDEYLLVISKQRGLVCHPSSGHETHTLANALLAHCGPDRLGTMQGSDRPGIVHRLDMDTTGLMLAAKDDKTQTMLQEAIRMKSVDRRYVTLVHGNIAPDTGLVDAPIARSPRDRLKMTVNNDLSARPSLTTFTVLERFDAGRRDDGYTLLECKLYTGRTHQIRVHMSYIGHPVVGDPMYGRGTAAQNLGLDRQFLHSWQLTFDHPRTGERMTFVDNLTWELEDVLHNLEEKTSGRTARGAEVHNAFEMASYGNGLAW